MDYPFTIMGADGVVIDRAANFESTISVLYGDLSGHDGLPRKVICPRGFVDALRYEAAIQADCWDIPIDIVKPPEVTNGPRSN